MGQRTWVADSGQVVLSWPGYFPPNKPIHRAIAALEVGSDLILRTRAKATGWELLDTNGMVVSRMAQAFKPPTGIVGVRVAAIAVRHKTTNSFESLSCDSWEVVLPEIVYLPDAGGVKP